MPNDALSTEQLIEEIPLLLGGSTVEIELTEKDIRLAALRALRMWNRYLPRQGKAALAVVTSQKKYRIDDLHPGLLGVVDVDFLSSLTPPTVIDPFDPMQTSIGLGYGDETYGDVMQRRVFAEDASRIVSSEPEWHGQWETVAVGPANELQYFLYIDVVLTSSSCGYTYNVKYQDTDDPGLGRLAIPEGEVQLFTDLVLAYAKQVLARSRGKHQGIVGPEGQTDPMDSSDDRQEAIADLERIEAELKMRRRPGLPLTE